MTTSHEELKLRMGQVLRVLDDVDILTEKNLLLTAEASEWVTQKKRKEVATKRLEDELRSIYQPIRRALLYLLLIVCGSGVVVGLAVMWVLNPMLVVSIFMGVLGALTVMGVMEVFMVPKKSRPPQWLVQLVKWKNMTKLMLLTYKVKQEEKCDPTQQLF